MWQQGLNTTLKQLHLTPSAFTGTFSSSGFYIYFSSLGLILLLQNPRRWFVPSAVRREVHSFSHPATQALSQAKPNDQLVDLHIVKMSSARSSHMLHGDPCKEGRGIAADSADRRGSGSGVPSSCPPSISACWHPRSPLHSMFFPSSWWAVLAGIREVHKAGPSLGACVWFHFICDNVSSITAC